nr:hypothetical protein [Georgenia sp. H159]
MTAASPFSSGWHTSDDGAIRDVAGNNRSGAYGGISSHSQSLQHDCTCPNHRLFSDARLTGDDGSGIDIDIVFENDVVAHGSVRHDVNESANAGVRREVSTR